MRHVIEQKDNNSPLFHPIRIDLRATDISAQDSLYSSILRQVSTERPKFFGLVKSWEIGLPGYVSTTFHFRKPSNLVGGVHELFEVSLRQVSGLLSKYHQNCNYLLSLPCAAIPTNPSSNTNVEHFSDELVSNFFRNQV